MTIIRTARFRVGEDGIDVALGAIRAFVEATRSEPGTLRYESLRSVEEPTRFIHIMEFADDAAEAAHATSNAVNRFTAVLYPLCEEEPTFVQWTTVP